MGNVHRRRFLIGAGALVAAPLVADAQPAAKVYRIGMLLNTSRSTGTVARILQPFEQALRELGYVEGRNLLIEWRGAEGRLERLPALAAELVALKVDLIVAGAPQSAVAAKNVTGTIPIVFVAVADPIGSGLVKSLARPGGNVTGFATFGETMVGKRLELFREVIPRIGRLAVIYSSDDAAIAPALIPLREASAALKLQVGLHDVKVEADLEDAFRAIERERAEGLVVFLTTATFVHRKRILEFAATQRLPAVYGLAQIVEDGGLMSYSFSYADNYRRAAAYVDKILKGAKPGDLPVQQPLTLELTVNLKTATALGLTIPQSVLLRADRVIE